MTSFNCPQVVVLLAAREPREEGRSFASALTETDVRLAVGPAGPMSYSSFEALVRATTSDCVPHIGDRDAVVVVEGVGD